MPKLSGDSNVLGRSINYAYKPSTDLLSNTNIDWSLNLNYYNNISSNKTYTFSNTIENQTIVLVIKNTGASTITLGFPTLLKNLDFQYTVLAGKTTIYTFLKLNNVIYGIAAIDMQ